MPTSTLTALSFTTPNPDAGGAAVTGGAVGGHAATTCSVVGIGLENKTIKWSPYAGVNGVPSAVRVKFDWQRNGALGAGTSNGWSVTAGFGVGGGQNETVTGESNVSGASSGSVNYALTNGRIKNPLELFVANSITATGAIGQSVSLTITISNLTLEVDFADHMVVVMM